MHPILLDAAGHRRQPVTLPGYHAGRPPRNKGSCRRRHEPLLRGGRPWWKLEWVADERRRPARHSSGRDSMTSSCGRWLTPPSSWPSSLPAAAIRARVRRVKGNRDRATPRCPVGPPQTRRAGPLAIAIARPMLIRVADE